MLFCMKDAFLDQHIISNRCRHLMTKITLFRAASYHMFCFSSIFLLVRQKPMTLERDCFDFVFWVLAFVNLNFKVQFKPRDFHSGNTPNLVWKSQKFHMLNKKPAFLLAVFSLVMAIRSAVWKFLMYSLRIEVKRIKSISSDFQDNVWIYALQFIQINHFAHSTELYTGISNSWQLNLINHESFIWVKFKVNVDMLILVTVQFRMKCFFKFLRSILIESL